MVTACIVCGSRAQREVFNEFGIAVVRCRGCGHLFSTYEQEQDYAGYFGQELQGDTYWWDEAHQKMYRAFCRRYMHGRAGTLLDVGCGLGFFLNTTAKLSGWQSFGYEMSPAAVKFAREELRLANIQCGRVEEADFPPGNFQLITLWDVLEHLPDPDSMLKQCHELLAPEGVLFLHTPNGTVQLWKARFKKWLQGMEPGVHYLEAKDHVHLYSPAGLAKVLGRNGFSAVQFVHLPPIQSVSGSRNSLMRFVKNGWWQVTRGLARLTAGKLNLDNLFVAASKEKG